MPIEIGTIVYLLIGLAMSYKICTLDDLSGSVVLAMFWPLFILGMFYIILDDWWRGRHG